MNPIEKIRQTNLINLINDFGGVTKFANKIEKSVAQVSQWANGSPMPSGKARSISSDSARYIEAKLGLSSNFMDANHDSILEMVDNGSFIQKGEEVPLISWVRAGTWSEVEDHSNPGHADEWVMSQAKNISPHTFALRVEGDSMTAQSGISFPDGCVIIVDPERSPQSGDYVVAKDISTQKATFKKLTTDGSRWYLKPLNSAYPAIEIDDPAMRVIGVAVEWQMSGKL